MRNDSSKSIDLDNLSEREREVVSRAVDGYTDEQIAQSLGIALGTVNTYWVRIRVKLGSLSRTEIVAGVLRFEMERRVESLEEEIARLKSERAGSEGLSVTSEEEEPWRFLSLGYLCDAALVIDKQGVVIYANPHTRDLLRAGRHELEGVPFWELVRSEDGSSCEKAVREFFANAENRRTVVGLDTKYYGLRRDGTRVQITIAAEWFESPEGVIASVSLREFLPGATGHARMR